MIEWFNHLVDLEAAFIKAAIGPFIVIMLIVLMLLAFKDFRRK